MAISVDAQILIWGIKRQATKNREEMIERAVAFFRQCSNDHQQVYLPAQSFSEFLVGYDPAKRRELLTLLPRGFIVAPLDAKAAAIAADLQTNWNLLREIGAEFGTTRQQIKSDINVLASSIAVGAAYLYSEDAQMNRLAQGKMLVKGLPLVRPKAGHLFDPEDVDGPDC